MGEWMNEWVVGEQLGGWAHRSRDGWARSMWGQKRATFSRDPRLINRLTVSVFCYSSVIWREIHFMQSELSFLLESKTNKLHCGSRASPLPIVTLVFKEEVAISWSSIRPELWHFSFIFASFFFPLKFSFLSSILYKFYHVLNSSQTPGIFTLVGDARQKHGTISAQVGSTEWGSYDAIIRGHHWNPELRDRHPDEEGRGEGSRATG